MDSTQRVVACVIITCFGAATRLQADIAIPPLADSTITDGAHADTNYGTTQDLAVKADGKPGFNRKVYLLFDLSGVPEPITAVALRFTLLNQGVPPASYNYRVFGVKDRDRGDRPGGWLETGITWNNAPANPISSANALTRLRVQDLGTFAVSNTDTGGQEYLFTNAKLIAFLRADTNRLVTFIIVRDGMTESGPAHQFGAREAGDLVSPRLMMSTEPNRFRRNSR